MGNPPPPPPLTESTWIERVWTSRSGPFKLGLIFLVMALLGAGGTVGRSRYRAWKERRFVQQAQVFLDKGQFPLALLDVRKALALSPAGLQANRLMAELAERAGHPASVFWWKRVVDLEPANLSNRLRWIDLMLRFADPSLAAEALATVDASGRTTAEYQQLAARVAVAANELGAATQHLAEALRLNPADDLVRFNLAVLQLRSGDEAVRQEARLTLEHSLTNAAVADQGLRALTQDALRHQDNHRALSFSQQLIARPSAPFPDHLLHLTALKNLNDPGWTEALKSGQSVAGKDPVRVYAVGTWMIEHGLPLEALAWLGTLPSDPDLHRIVPMLSADCYLATKDWDKLERTLREEKWDQQEFLRYATLAYSLRNQGANDASGANWRKALNASGTHPEMLGALAHLSASWGWKSESEEALWTIARNDPRQKWALKSLHESYLTSGNTRGLLHLYTLMSKLSPDDLRLQNNCAAVSLLLHEDVENAHRLAHQVFEKDPKVPTFVSTWAYSLHLQGKTQDALQVMRQLSDEQLHNPVTAAYYAILLDSAGDHAQAKQFLVDADRARLLPEEKQLLDPIRTP